MRSLAIAVRTGSPAAELRTAVRDALHSAAPALPIATLHTIDDNIDQMCNGRLVAFLSSLFGVSVRCSPVSVSRRDVARYPCRTNEIGIRIALGAGHGDTSSGGARKSWLVVAGVRGRVAHDADVGVAALRSRAADLPTLAVSIGVMMLVALVATWIPVRRALAVDPVTALRSE